MLDIVIMAHGRQERLAGELDSPKHCLSLGNETILGRTVRLVRELGATRVGLCAPRGVLRSRPRWVRLRPTSSSITLVESMYAAALSPARGPQLFLLGDVVWSRAALEMVVRDTRDAPQFYGRIWANPFTGKPYGELYAVRVDPQELEPHMACTMLWELKAALHAPMVPIRDWTDDIDTPEDLRDRLPKLREFVQSEAALPHPSPATSGGL